MKVQHKLTFLTAILLAATGLHAAESSAAATPENWRYKVWQDYLKAKPTEAGLNKIVLDSVREARQTAQPVPHLFLLTRINDSQ